jgi:hypothetical protein
VAGYNPDLDSDGQGARKLIDLLTDVLSARLETTSADAAWTGDAASTSASSDTPSSKAELPATSDLDAMNEDPGPPEPDSASS